MTKRTVLLSIAAILSLPAAVVAAKAVDWTARVAISPAGGHVMGNPAAPTRIVEYVSYTCSHCARFVAEGTGPLKILWVKPGRATVEVRNAVRDRYDLAAALIARCGGKDRFMGNHEALFANQDAWMPQLETYDAANREITPGASQTAMLQDIGKKTGLYALMAKRGLTPKQLDACIADPAAMAKVTAMTDEAWNKVKISGTPGFTVNGALTGGSTWAGLRGALPGGAK